MLLHPGPLGTYTYPITLKPPAHTGEKGHSRRVHSTSYGLCTCFPLTLLSLWPLHLSFVPASTPALYNSPGSCAYPRPCPGISKICSGSFLFPLTLQPLESPPDIHQRDGLVPARLDGSEDIGGLGVFSMPSLWHQLWKDWYDNSGSHLSFPCFWSASFLKNIAHGSNLWSAERENSSKASFSC